MKTRTLALRRETLTELAAGDLTGVVGGSHGCVTHTVVPSGCKCTGLVISLNYDCPTLDDCKA